MMQKQREKNIWWLFIGLAALITIFMHTYKLCDIPFGLNVDEAGAAYEMGEWTSAIETYDAISSMGVESPQLYYNMGNAYYRLGDYANAVLYYERALKLDSSLTDAQFNLEHVNGLLQDKIDVVPEFFLKEWLRNLSRTMSSNSWAWLSLGLLAVTLGLLLVFRLASSITWRRAGFFTGLVSLLIMVAALSFSV